MKNLKNKYDYYYYYYFTVRIPNSLFAKTTLPKTWNQLGCILFFYKIEL